MTKEFVPYWLALELKELGFDEPCFGYYLEDGTWTPASYSKKGTVYPSNTDLLPDWSAAPLYQQAFRWFREKYGLCGHIKPENNEDDIIAWEYVILTIVDDFAGVANASEVCFTTRKSNYTTYEEAELACLQKLIEIVKPK